MKKRTYILLNENNRDTTHKFKGYFPSRVARKLASRGYNEIRLRRTGTKKVHIYKGWKIEVDNSKKEPEWLKQRKYVGFAKKITIKKL